jgi:polyisoprenoid-binding protein YceI
VLILLIGVVAYTLFRTPAEASGPIEAIPLAESTTTESSAPAETATTSVETVTETTSPAAADVTATAGSASPDAASTQAASGSSSGTVVLQIVQDESEARFIIDEILNGAPKTVIGTTNQVAGQIEVDPADPAKSRVGTIQVNARTLATDSSMRNRTIANRILNTDQYEFITFTPSSLVALPASGAIGQSYSFQVVGNLTIRDVSKEVTFDVTLTPTGETRLEGNASSTIRYADFGIAIPQVRQVAGVDEEVRLELDFVAVAS